MSVRMTKRTIDTLNVTSPKSPSGGVCFLTRGKRTKRPRRRRPPSPAAFIALALAVLLAASVSVGFTWSSRDAQSMALAGALLLRGLQDNNMDVALNVCAEGPQGAQVLQVEERRVFTYNVEPGDPRELADAAANRILTLRELRADLAERGVDWASVRSLAFGGLRAKVQQTDVMRAPVTVVWGNLYFSAHDQVYAIEVSAWRCRDRYVFVDLWNCTTVPISPDDLSAYSRTQYRRILKEVGGAREDAEIIRPGYVFYAF